MCHIFGLVDGVWRMPLWQDSAHPLVLRSDKAIAGAIRPQRTLGTADKRVSWHTDSLPPSESSNSGEPLPALGAADKQVSWHSDYLPLPEASNSGEPLPVPIRGSPYRARNQRRLWLFSSTHRRQILKISMIIIIIMLKSTLFENTMINS